MSPQSESTVRFCFFGDLSLHGEGSAASLDESLLALLRGADVVVGNLESPAAGNGGENLLKFPRVVARPEAYSILEGISPDFLSLANNHAFDALTDGHRETAEILERNGIKYAGAGPSAESARRGVVIERKGIRIAILAYADASTNPSIPEGAPFHLNIFSLDRAVEDLRRLEGEADLRVVYLHWGRDFCPFYSPDQRKAAEALASAGADIVVGTHAHVPQPVERIGGCVVAYGLGNFLFPDIHLKGYDRVWSTASRRSLVLEVSAGRDGVRTHRVHGTVQNGLRVSLDGPAARRRAALGGGINALLRSDPAWRAYLFGARKFELMSRYLFARDKGPVAQFLGLRPRHAARLFTGEVNAREVRIKKDRLKKALKRIVIESPLARALLRRHRERLLVLCFHGVTSPERAAETANYEGRHVPSPDFEATLALFLRFFGPVTLSEVRSFFYDGADLPPNPLLVTFDDGFENNFTDAFPVLKKLGCPATVFVATGLVGNSKGLWIENLEYAVHRSSKKRFEADVLGESLSLSLASVPEKERVFRVLLGKLKGRAAAQEVDDAARGACAALGFPGLDRVEGNPDYRFLDWKQIREMAAAGISFGSHTVNHANLAHESAPSARAEIVDSKRELENRLGAECFAFCYPYGRSGAGDEPDRLVREAGYLLNFDLRGRLNDRETDPYRISRYALGRGFEPRDLVWDILRQRRNKS